MSLINKLLQDLEKRQASDSQVEGLDSSVRAVSHHRRISLWLVALLLAAGAGFVALTYLDEGPYWSIARHRPAMDSSPVTPAVQEVAPAVAVAAEPEAAIQAALLAPVFQLSDELSRLPSAPQSETPATSERPPSFGQNQSATRPAPAAAPASALPSQPKQAKLKKMPAPSDKPKTSMQAAVTKTTARPLPPAAPTRAAAPKPAALPVRPQSDAPSDKLEEVTIPERASPIDKQVRALTAYERAEVEFRNGVAKLREGRVIDAEAAFRAAIAEDASHLAARQALIGLLIDLGRNIDAEEVLRHALDLNPRQPRHAMLLARLELERGDTEGAIRTLESVRPYAGVDPDYLAFFAAALERAGRHEEAAERYRDALAIVPTNAVWMMGLGISLRAANRPQEALDAFQHAAAAKMLNPELQAYVEAQASELRPGKR